MKQVINLNKQVLKMAESKSKKELDVIEAKLKKGLPKRLAQAEALKKKEKK